MQDLKRIFSSARNEAEIQRAIDLHLRGQGLDSSWVGGLKFADRIDDPPPPLEAVCCLLTIQ